MADHLIEDNYLLLNSDKKTIAMLRGWQKTFDSYYMQFTAVHTDYRTQENQSGQVPSLIRMS